MSSLHTYHQNGALLYFDDWVFDPTSGELWNGRKSNCATRLEPKPGQVLNYLLTHRGLVVSRAELLNEIWPNRVVVDETLTRCISLLRQALRDTRPHYYIQTLPKRGYRFNSAERPAPMMCRSPTGPPLLAHLGSHALPTASQSDAASWALCELL